MIPYWEGIVNSFLGEGSKGEGEQGRSEQGRGEQGWGKQGRGEQGWGKPSPYILILPGEGVDKELLGGAAVDADA
jgi:hypothetical protein